jgi:hypothetical protein
MLLEIWRAVISSDMDLVYCARAVRSQSSRLLAIEAIPPCVRPNKYHGVAFEQIKPDYLLWGCFRWSFASASTPAGCLLQLIHGHMAWTE